MTGTVPVTTMTAPPAGLTYEEFLDWAPDGTHAEWVEGEIIIMSPACSRHQRLSGFLQFFLTAYAQFHALGEIFSAPLQMRCTPTGPGREPDILFVARENLDRIKANHLAGPADLAIEIISPESRTRDSVDKFREYAEGGVREFWLIDPEKKEARFFFLVDGAYREIATLDGKLASTVMPGLQVKVDWLWSLPPLPSVLSEMGLRLG